MIVHIDRTDLVDGYTPVDGDITDAVAVVGEGKCLEAGLLDEILVHIAPVLLGDGVRLVDHPGGTKVMWLRVK